MGRRFAQDFSRVRVHVGPDSAEAAERLGARAYTLGTDIHLGAETRGMTGRELDRLLAHEAVHTVQQGGRPASPHAGLSVSDPGDAAERAAARIADSVANHEAAPNVPGSGPGQPDIAHAVGPHLQRDLTGKKAVNEGAFELNMAPYVHPGGKSGMEGTIVFTPNQKAPDSDHIRLLQVVRNEDLATGKDYAWGRGKEVHAAVSTTADKGVDPGYFVDQTYSKIKPRSQKSDESVSPYYIDYWNTGKAENHDGSKKGKTIVGASLHDHPGFTRNMRFSFETAAKDSGTGHVFGSLKWGFTLSDAAKGTVDKEHADANQGPSATLGAAVTKFNEFFRNPGSSKAP